MRGWSVGLVLGVGVATVFVGACALDEGGTAGDGGGLDVTVDVVGVDATPDADAGGGDAAPDVGVDGDAQTADVVADVGSPCAKGTACLPVLTGAFRYVEYEGANPTACTPGFGAQQNLLENPQSKTNDCTCSCAAKPATDPTCTCGGTTAAFDILSGSNCPPNGASELLAGTTCYTTTQSLTGNNDAIVAKPDAGCTPSGGSCGTASATPGFTWSATQTRRCDVSGAPPACTGGSCVPTPAGNYKLCVTDGTVLTSCPAGFPNAHVVGTSVSDTRTCSCTGSCAIANAGTCGTPNLTLYTTSADCSSGAQPAIPADGTTCKTGFGTNPSWGSAKYASANTGASCGYSGGTSIGGAIALSGAYTICCQ